MLHRRFLGGGLFNHSFRRGYLTRNILLEYDSTGIPVSNHVVALGFVIHGVPSFIFYNLSLFVSGIIDILGFRNNCDDLAVMTDFMITTIVVLTYILFFIRDLLRSKVETLRGFSGSGLIIGLF